MFSFEVLLFAVGLVVAVLLSLGFSIHINYDRTLNQVYEHLSWKTVKVVMGALVASNLVNAVSYFQPRDMFTHAIYSWEGSLVAVFQSFTHPILDFLFILIYLVVYPVLIILTYLVLHSNEGRSEVKYVGSYIILVISSAPFFHFLPVEVTGYFLGNVRPILYEFHPVIHQGITAFDPLTKALPSLHTGISVLAFIYSYKYTEKYKMFAGIATFLIILSTFYLGVHWIIDALLGALMALSSFVIVDYGYIDSSIVPSSIEDRLEAAADELSFKVTI